MTGSSTVDAPFSEMFPHPDVDNWYDRFVSIPWTKRLNPPASRVEIAPAIPVSLFMDATIDQSLVDRLITVTPHNVREAALTGIDWCANPPHPILKNHRLQAATRVILEAPILATTPSVDSGAWNEGLLTVDLPATAEIEPISSNSQASVSLTNVFLEFSPLEHIGWEKVEHGRPIEVLRGVWLVREGSKFVVSIFFSVLPAPAGLTGLGGFTTTYDDSTKRLVFENADRNKPEIAAAVVKRLFSTLFLLRGLTPGPHVNPFPVFQFLQPNGTIRCSVPWFRQAEVVLVQATSATDNSTCLVPRMNKTRAEYFTPFKRDGELLIDAPSTGFADVDPAVIIGRLLTVT
jgi:hypothetical protein